MESTSEYGYFVNLHAIEQTRLRGQCRVDFHTDEGLEAGGGLVEGARPRITNSDVEPRVEMLRMVLVFLRRHHRKVAPRVEDVARREGRDARAAAPEPRQAPSHW